jgi:hypothetical protein
MRAMHEPWGISLAIVGVIFIVAQLVSMISALVGLTLFLVRRSRVSARPPGQIR